MESLIGLIIGAVLGSFIAVVIDRVPKKEGILWGRSFCRQCQQRLSWLDLCPIISAIYLKWQCRYCQHSFSKQDTLIEVVMGLTLASLIYYWGSGHIREISLSFLLIALCLAVSIIDLREGYIYPSILLTFVVLRLMWLQSYHELIQLSLSFLVAFSLYVFIYLIGKLIFKKEALGVGDIYFMATIALWLNIKQVIITGLGAFWVGLIVVGLYYSYYKKMLIRIPFAPMMSIACLISYFFEVQLTELIFC